MLFPLTWLQVMRVSGEGFREPAGWTRQVCRRVGHEGKNGRRSRGNRVLIAPAWLDVLRSAYAYTSVPSKLISKQPWNLGTYSCSPLCLVSKPRSTVCCLGAQSYMFVCFGVVHHVLSCQEPSTQHICRSNSRQPCAETRMAN